MLIEKIIDILEKIPWSLLLIVWVIFLGVRTYFFYTDEESDLKKKFNEKTLAISERDKVNKDVRDIDRFKQEVSRKSMDVRNLMAELEGLKGSLSEQLYEADFMGMTIQLAKRVGFIITGIKPTQSTSKEFYREKPFEVRFQGIFSQVLLFLDSASKNQRVMRVDKIKMKPTGSNSVRFVQLEGELTLKGYEYVGTQADTITPDTPAAAPAAAPKGGKK